MESTGPHGYIYVEIGSDGTKAEFVPVAAREYKRIDYHVDNYTRDGELGEAIERLLNIEGMAAKEPERLGLFFWFIRY